MKHIGFLVITLFACVAFAQAPKEPAKEAAKPEAMKEAAKPAAEPAKQAAAAPKKPRRWNEDARHCLERPSNTDVIKCAEEFL
jgi:hypothetical protein